MKPYYEDEDVTLFCGDCMTVWPAIAGAFDHLVTDPPYTSHTHQKQWIGAALTSDGAPRVKTAHKELGFPPISPAERHFIASLAFMDASRWALVFSDLEGAHEWRDVLLAVGLDYVRTCVWDKVDSAPQFTGDRPAAGAEVIVCAHRPGAKRWNGGGKRNVYRHAVNGGTGAKPHPSTKPLTLMIELLTDFTDQGETILDPFAGSGTTGVAAKLNGRKAILIEREEKYCEVAAKRLAETRPGRLFERLPKMKPGKLFAVDGPSVEAAEASEPSRS